MSNELYHWKYIKREKVGNKWKYYYDTGANAKKNYEQAKQKLDTYNRQEKGAKVRGLTGADHEHSRGHAFNKYSQTHYSLDGPRMKLEKEYEEAKSEYYDSPMGKREQRAENTKRTVQKVKNWAKDKLGYDEKQRMSAAETNAKVRAYKSNDIIRENNKWLTENPGHKNIADLVNWQNNYVRELADEAEKAYRDAQKEFEKTPLAKLESMKKTIDSAKDWVSDLFKRSGAPEPVLSSPNPTVITENIIKENVIPEKAIKEKVIEQEVIPDQYIYEERIGADGKVSNRRKRR